MKNLNINVPLKNQANPGTYQLLVRFIVSSDGFLEDIVAETNHGYGMEEELIRFIKTGPKWIPAIKNGQHVKAYRRQPVSFFISDQ